MRYNISELGVMADQFADDMRELEQRLEIAERKRMYEHTYVVQGKGDFPTDMLRYDTSYPLDDINSYEGLWGAALVHRGLIPDWTPTMERWRSFGWGVLADSLRLVS